MKHIVIVLLVLLVASCSSMPKVPTPAPERQQPARVNILNGDGFLIGFFVFGDSLYYKGISGTEREAAQTFYDSMKPSESVIPFMDALFDVIEERSK